MTSIKQEFDSLLERGVGHTHLVQYSSMRHEALENRIVVEVSEEEEEEEEEEM